MLATIILTATLFLATTSGITSLTMTECAKQIQMAEERIEAEKRKGFLTEEKKIPKG